MRYLFILERHKTGHLHVHGLIYGIPSSYMVDANRTDKNGSKIYNVKGWQHGFSTAIKIYKEDENSNAKMSRYITKYMTEDLENVFEKGDQRYYASQGLLKPVVVYDLSLEYLNSLGITDITQNPFYAENEDYKVYNIKLDPNIAYNLLTAPK